MKRQEKEILYNKFTNDFGANFEKACFIIKYLSTYPELTSKISNIKLLNIEDIKESQLEWISLVNQLEHPLEIEFFKTYWVPIQCDGYDYFIDLSSETFSLFEINYFPFKPYNWSINNIFQNISDLLLVTDENKIEIKSYMNKIKQQNLKKMLHFVNERNKLGLIGMIEPDETNNESLFEENTESSFHLYNNTLVLKGVSSLSINFLPLELEMQLNSFESSYCRFELNYLKRKIKQVKGFVYLLQCVGFRTTKSYLIILSTDKDEYVNYCDNILTIKYNDKSFLNHIISKYKSLKKSLK